MVGVAVLLHTAFTIENEHSLSFGTFDGVVIGLWWVFHVAAKTLVNVRTCVRDVEAYSRSLVSSWPGASLRTLRLLTAIRLSAASPCQLLLVAVRFGLDDEASGAFLDVVDVDASSSGSLDFAAFLVFFAGFLGSTASSSGSLFLLRFEFRTASACSSAYVFTCVRTRPERLGPSVAILIVVSYSSAGICGWEEVRSNLRM